MTVNFGMKVSQSGYDVKTCGDKQLLFSSSFPTLKIFKQGKVKGNFPIEIEHNLGYQPVFTVYDNNTTGQSFRQFGYNECYVTNKKLVIDQMSGTFYYYIFLNKIDDIIKPETISETTMPFKKGGSYGFKISQEKSDIQRDNVKDFVLHSGYPQHIIHLQNSLNTPITADYSFEHNLGYKPMHWGFVYYSNVPERIYYEPNIGMGYFFANNTKIRFSLNKSGTLNNLDRIYFIVFKDSSL